VNDPFLIVDMVVSKGGDQGCRPPPAPHLRTGT
jgi:hypothetical protein